MNTSLSKIVNLTSDWLDVDLPCAFRKTPRLRRLTLLSKCQVFRFFRFNCSKYMNGEIACCRKSSITLDTSELSWCDSEAIQSMRFWKDSERSKTFQVSCTYHPFCNHHFPYPPRNGSSQVCNIRVKHKLWMRNSQYHIRRFLPPTLPLR